MGTEAGRHLTIERLIHFWSPRPNFPKRQYCPVQRGQGQIEDVRCNRASARLMHESHAHLQSLPHHNREAPFRFLQVETAVNFIAHLGSQLPNQHERAHGGRCEPKEVHKLHVVRLLLHHFSTGQTQSLRHLGCAALLSSMCLLLVVRTGQSCQVVVRCVGNTHLIALARTLMVRGCGMIRLNP